VCVFGKSEYRLSFALSVASSERVPNLSATAFFNGDMGVG